MILNKLKFITSLKKYKKSPKQNISNNYSRKCEYYNQLLWKMLLESLNVNKSTFNMYDFSCYIAYYYSIEESDEAFSVIFNGNLNVNYNIFKDFLHTLNDTDYKEIINCIEFGEKIKIR